MVSSQSEFGRKKYHRFRKLYFLSAASSAPPGCTPVCSAKTLAPPAISPGCPWACRAICRAPPDHHPERLFGSPPNFSANSPARRPFRRTVRRPARLAGHLAGHSVMQPGAAGLNAGLVAESLQRLVFFPSLFIPLLPPWAG